MCCIGCPSSLPATNPYGIASPHNCNCPSPAFLPEKEGGECVAGGRGRLVLLLGPDGPEGPPGAWGGSLYAALWLRPFQLLYLCFSPPSSMSNIWCNRDHLNLALPLKTHRHFHPAGLWDELGEQVHSAPQAMGSGECLALCCSRAACLSVPVAQEDMLGTEEFNRCAYLALVPGWGHLELGTESITASALVMLFFQRAPWALPSLPVFTIHALLRTNSHLSSMGLHWCAGDDNFALHPEGKPLCVKTTFLQAGQSTYPVTRQLLEIRCRDTNLIKEQDSTERKRWQWVLEKEADLLFH